MLAGIVVKNMYSVARRLYSAFDLNSSMSPYGNDTDPMPGFPILGNLGPLSCLGPSYPQAHPVLPTALTLHYMKCYRLVPETRSCHSLFGGVMLSLPPMLDLRQAPARYNVEHPLSANDGE